MSQGLLLPLLALALGACGGGEDAPSTVAETTATETVVSSTETGATTDTGATTGTDTAPEEAPTYPGSGPPFCVAQYQLDYLADRALGGLSEESSPEEIEAAIREFVEANEDLLQEFEDTAPPQVASDAALLVADLRAKAGLSEEPQPDPAEVAAAEERVEEAEGEIGCVD